MCSPRARVSNADIYQLVTYCARLGLTTGHLIYADGGVAPPPYEVTGTGTAIAVHRIDLTTSPDELRSRVSDLAEQLMPGRRGAWQAASAGACN